MRYRVKKIRTFLCSVVLAFFIAALTAYLPVQAQDLSEFEKRMTEFSLDNGLKFLIYERHEAPVISFHIHADVGSVDEVKGITGMAHIFEHMAFKGTTTTGTTDYEAEAKLMDRMDKLFDEIKTEQRKGDQADEQRIEQLQEQFDHAQEDAQKYIVHDEYEEVLTREGAAGFNAYTSDDYTCYIVSLPSNKLELWISLESDRFAHPVLREFYKEKNVIMEERRMSENRPTSRLYEEFNAIAFLAHPYGEPVIGHMSDIGTITRSEAKAFFKKYYSPSNLTIAVVGDVSPEQVKRLAKKYFGGIPSGPKPEPVETEEPPQRGERRVTIEDPAQPMIIIGYHQPGINHVDNAVFLAIDQIIGTGRTSRLYKSLVKEKKIAVSVASGSGWSKYPSLFAFRAIPAKGHTNQECEEAIYAEIGKLKKEPVTPEELAKAKAQVRASLIRMLDSNDQLARELAFYDVITGDWKNLFEELDKIEKVSADDIQRVAGEYFTRSNRSVGVIETVQDGN